MSAPPRLSDAQRAAMEAEEDRALSPEEFAARVAAPWTAAEREDFLELVTWFRRRDPTPYARLQATRHLAAQWRRSRSGGKAARRRASARGERVGAAHAHVRGRGGERVEVTPATLAAWPRVRLDRGIARRARA